MSKETIFTEGATAEALGNSVRTLQAWRVQGRGPVFVKIGKRIGYLPEDIEAFVAASRRISTRQRVDAT